MDWTEIVRTIVEGFPMMAALALGWYLAETRARRWERRFVALVRECADLPDEDITNGADLP